jgi:hypothetical protein
VSSGKGRGYRPRSVTERQGKAYGTVPDTPRIGPKCDSEGPKCDSRAHTPIDWAMNSAQGPSKLA